MSDFVIQTADGFEVAAFAAIEVAKTEEPRSAGEDFMLAIANTYALLAISQRLAELFNEYSGRGD